MSTLRWSRTYVAAARDAAARHRRCRLTCCCSAAQCSAVFTFNDRGRICRRCRTRPTRAVRPVRRGGDAFAVDDESFAGDRRARTPHRCPCSGARRRRASRPGVGPTSAPRRRTTRTSQPDVTVTRSSAVGRIPRRYGGRAIACRRVDAATIAFSPCAPRAVIATRPTNLTSPTGPACGTSASRTFDFDQSGSAPGRRQP